MYLCMLAWIMDMFLLFNSIVYMLSCVIVHVLARALIYLLVWWHGNTHTHRHTHSTQEVKPEWKSRRKGRKTEIERLNMCDEWVKRSKLFLPPTNVSTETNEGTNERQAKRLSECVSERAKESQSNFKHLHFECCSGTLYISLPLLLYRAPLARSLTLACVRLNAMSNVGIKRRE